MIAEIAALALSALVGPCSAMADAAASWGGWSPAVVREVAHRESRCAAVGVHERDARHAATFAAGVCAPGWWVATWPAREWAPRGPWGTAPAYAWCALPEPLRLLPPHAIDHPVLGAAIVAAHHRYVSRRACAGVEAQHRDRCVALARGNRDSRREWRETFKEGKIK